MEKKLTLEDINGFPMCTYGRAIGKQLANKVMFELINYKQFEEELGIDLITLFKAFVEGIWAKKRNEIVYVKAENLRFEGKIDCGKPLLTVFVFKELYYEDLDGVMATTGYEWELEDYSKTWAITKEELL